MTSEAVHSLRFLFDRELDRLAAEIASYPDEASIWQVRGDIINPGGNLCLHLCGNLQHYIGAVLGGSGYQRNRPLEFSAKGVARAALMEQIAKTKNALSDAFDRLDDEALSRPYPEDVLGYPMSTGFFLYHLFGHLGYHLGQINYHRRIISIARQVSEH